MGVPKFFRYISERYPCLSEVVREYQIPEFDNMYLDMNGIIHMCSHPDDNNPHFRITEERIFRDIFHYIEVLFRMIRPQKLFFMAIDGVAPRAKMNQQRGRRFRSAKDADKQEAEAKKRGEALPTEARFDSNCITPGTVFMARLHEQLKYFCTEKISNDPLWRNVEVILSGHETPGEGEHKIMDYIRYLRAQPGYDPNTRHCLYGLDADLIMLGLCTHEPHFSLLREEVKFGKKSTKRQSVPEEITFFLLHLSLMREYLELEFAPVKDKLVGFEYDFEKIIDDWVLMGFLVGNDFIPNLPHLHIANGALPILYKAYMEVLPTLDGYINEAGSLNLARFEKFMQKLTNFDIENFEEIKDDLLYMEAKTGRKFNMHSQSRAFKGGHDLQKWLSDDMEAEMGLGNPQLENGNAKSVRDPSLEQLIQAADELDIESDEDDEDDDEDKAFTNHKREYYMNKLEYENVTREVLRAQAEGYVRAIQWNLNYYYNGVCSWSWYYPHHYAPYISDIKGFADLKLDFDLGTPFKPYEQLLAVLPAASKELLPKAYHHLMTDENSPIINYYPEEFQTDKNGKRQEWEAVVLIPFIDEKRLLEAMKPCNELLSPEEEQRNKHGPMLIYAYSDQDFGKYESPEYFPPVKHNHAKMVPVTIESIRVPRDKLVKGAYPGASMDLFYPGFPTFKHLKYTGELRKAKVKVFEQPSRYENMIIRILQEEYECNIPVDLLSAHVFVGWPHLIEAKIVAMSNIKTKYISMGDSSQYNTEEIESKGLFQDQCAGIIERYKNRLGIEVGDVRILCHVQVLIGRKYVFTPNGKLTLEKQFSEMTANYPLQAVVTNIDAYDSHRTLFKSIQDVFPEGEICFTLSNPYYGAQGIVVDSKETHRTGRIKVCVSVVEEPNFDKLKIMKNEIIRSYKTLFNAASQLGMSHFLFSRITGSVYVEIPDGEGGLKNVNVGLDLKFNKKNKETPGYTKKIATTWYYTNKCTELVREYSEKFPEIFVYFSEHGNEDATMEHIFGDVWEEKLVELQQWLRSIPTYSMERQPCGSQVTEPEIVEEIEKIIDNTLKNATSKKVTMTIKPSFLYKPELQNGTLPPDPKMQVQIFDRIVNTRKGFSVPFGLKGTVIAITESPTKNERDTMYDVVFDKPFKDGLQLNCSSGRGYRLPKNAFIDISYGKRLLEQKAGKEGSLLAMAESGQKPENPWHATNGQKFFNQFMYNTPSYRQIPDQYNYYHPKPAGQEAVQESAFAPFSKTRGFHNTPVPNQQVPEIPSDSQNYKSPKIERKDTAEQENGEAIRDESVAMFAINNRKTSPSKNKMAVQSYPPEQAPNTDTYTYNKEIKNHTAQLSKKTNESADMFVPRFVKTEKEPKGVEQSQPKVLKAIPVDPKNNQDPRRPVVNTGFLKKLLKIDSKTIEEKDVTSPRAPSEAPVKETSSNVSFEMLAHVANSPASVRLLTYYQSNGLGIPRYQYFQTGNKYKAQINLTNGDLVMSEPADTKEEATEKVASEVLRLLMKRGTPNDMVTSNTNKTLPVPPKTWVEPTKEKSVDRDSDEALKAALHNPFVPTQVIKRQISKTGSTATSQKKGQGNSANSASNGTESRGAKSRSTNNDENKALSAPTSNSLPQKKRQKSSRIAANFAMK